MPYMNNPPYYLTAYGIAVKHGFVGSETKWLKSLKGDPGTGLVIVDSFETETALREKYPSGISSTEGFCRVGMDDNNYLLYYWDAVDQDWYSISLTGPAGPQGEKGPPPSPVSESCAYAIGTSSTEPPTEGWVERITDPDSVKGKVVWTRTDITWDNGEESSVYASAYNGGDATGTVISINGKDGIVNLVAENILCEDESDVQDHLDAAEEDIGELQEDVGEIQETIGTGVMTTAAQTLIGAVNELQEETEDAAYTASGRSNPNLLDNWWFGPGVINQRGLSGYDKNTAHYSGSFQVKCTIDRWFLGNDKTEVTVYDANGYVTVSGSSGVPYLQQLIPAKTRNAILGRKVTLSLLTAAGVLHTVSGTMPASMPVSATVLLNIEDIIDLQANADGKLKVRIKAASGGSINVLAVKLELGEKQSLARLENGSRTVNEIPNQTMELLKCQRYLVPLSGMRVRAYEISANEIKFLVPLPVEKAEDIFSGDLINGEDHEMKVLNLSGTAQSSVNFAIGTTSYNHLGITAQKTSHGLTDAVLYFLDVFYGMAQ